MATIISSLLFTDRDENGNRWTRGYMLVEFRDTGYVPGGENIDLTSRFRRIEDVDASPASGVLEYDPRPNYGDYPGNAGSTRLRLYYGASGLVTLNVSGLPIQILSGSIISLASGVMNPASGRIGVAGSGFFAAGFVPMEVLSGVAVSGIRAKIRVLGY